VKAQLPSAGKSPVILLPIGAAPLWAYEEDSPTCLGKRPTDAGHLPGGSVTARSAGLCKARTPADLLSAAVLALRATLLVRATSP